MLCLNTVKKLCLYLHNLLLKYCAFLNNLVIILQLLTKYMVLSGLDKKILSQLANIGVTFQADETSKLLRINKTTLAYKLKKFEQEKILLGYRFRVDYRKIGLKQIAWVFISVKFGAENINDLIDKILRFPEVHLCAVVTGDFDLALKVYSKNIEQLTLFLLEFRKHFRNEIKEVSVHFVGAIFKSHNIIVEQNPALIPFDETDLKILSTRLIFPKKPLSLCAKEINIHRNTISSRWKRFVTQKLILKKSVIINPEHFYDLNRGLQVFVFIESIVGKIELLADKLSKLEAVHELNLLSQPFDLMAIVRVKDVSEFYAFQNKICSSPEFREMVLSTKSLIVLNSKSRKHTYLKDLPSSIFSNKK